MDKLIQAAADIDDLQYRIHCAIELVRSVHESITDGANEPGQNEYDALFGVYCLLHSLDMELEETSERLWNAGCRTHRSYNRKPTG